MIENLNWKEVLKGVTVVGVIIILSLMFPSKRHDSYAQKEGSIWTSSDLFADAEFGVDKTKEQIAKESIDLKSKILPIFVENKEAGDRFVNEMLTFLSKSIQEVRDHPVYFKDKLQSLYNTGVVNQSISSRHLEIERAGQRVKISNDRIYTKEKAIDYIRKEVSKLGVDAGVVNALKLDGMVQPNLIINNSAYDEKLELALKNLPKTDAIVKKGELIIAKGDQINEYVARKLSAYDKYLNKNKGTKQNNAWTFFGYLLLTCLIIGALIFYLKKYYPLIDDTWSGLFFILLWPLLFGFLIYTVEKSASLNPYIIPFCIVPIIVKNFYPGRIALFLHIVVVLIASILSSQGYEFTFLQVLAGIITVLVVSETRYWNKFFIAILMILATYIIGYIGLALIREGNISSINPKMFVWLGINGVLLMLAYPFIPLLEKIFGFTSSISLVELSEMNQPLLKELSIKAPGTLQHSLQVANLAEAAAEKIGANSLLVKTAALYHDIGKIANPKFYIENASSDENKHQELNNNFASAKIIIDHVVEGEKMAKKARLPKIITDFITTHHGTTRVEYFYRNQKNMEPDKEFDESLFRYPGPLPTTKEQSILMVADSIEAASKSLKSPTGQDIDGLVDGIIKYKIDQHQFNESSLSFSELEECTKVFKSLLRSIYHVRVEYPTGKEA